MVSKISMKTVHTQNYFLHKLQPPYSLVGKSSNICRTNISMVPNLRLSDLYNLISCEGGCK